MRYPGGKGKCYQRIINLMPQHHTYIETHLGGGAVMRYKLPADRNIGIDLDSRVIQRWRDEESGICELVQADAVSFIRDFQFQGSELIYVDPPYIHSTRKRSRIYRHEYSDADHLNLLHLIAKLPCYVMVSGYENKLYDQWLINWRKEYFNAKTHTGIRVECVWMNFDPPQKLHDSRYLGNNFRERQTVARRRARLYDRIEQMDPIERNELIQWVNAKYGLEAV